ncbi:MAG: hypothetical protein Q9216_005923 [Gyalolechia sp. 2 TL-2023]
MDQEFYNESRLPPFYGSTITLMVAATIAVALRLVARSMSAAKLWWDDWILVLALFFDYGLSICYWLQATHAGLGRHTTVVGGPVEPDKVVLYYKIFLPLQLFYFTSSFAIKTSLILLYYRLFAIHRWFRFELLGAWIIVILYYLVDFLVAVFECNPVAYFWDKSIEGGTCIDQTQFFRWNGVANLLIDFMILTLTMPLIWGLKLKLRQKVSLSAVFLLGLFACVASIVRVITFNQVEFDDITFTIVDASIWSTIEQSVGIICACLLTYQPLFRRLFAKVRGYSDKFDSENAPSRAISMQPWRSKSAANVSGDPGSAGFSRLNEKHCLENGVTTRVTAERVVGSEAPAGILRNQAIEQHHELIDRPEEAGWRSDRAWRVPGKDGGDYLIKQSATTLDRFHVAHDHPSPSLAADGVHVPIPSGETETLAARDAILHATRELRNLVLGPLGILMNIGSNEVLCLQAIYRYKIAQSFGFDEQPSFETVSEACGLNVQDLQRIVRYSMTDNIFIEPKPGHIAHTAVSRLLASSPPVNDFVGNVCEIRFPASTRAVDALEKYGKSQDANQCGFSLANNTALGVYDELARDHPRAQRWNGAMRALAMDLDFQFILDSKVWTCCTAPTIVDVGGGCGDVSIGLASHLPSAQFIVEDASLEALQQGGTVISATPFSERMTFQYYNFLSTPQPVHNADIYYFRNIFHNWPDKNCITILRNQIPALEEGSRLVIDDFTLHEAGTLAPMQERKRRWMDINMLIFFGSRERTIREWEKLLQEADGRFRLQGVREGKGPNMILDVMWVTTTGEGGGLPGEGDGLPGSEVGPEVDGTSSINQSCRSIEGIQTI